MHETEMLYQKKLARYMTAMDCGKPDVVPVLFGIGEWVVKYKGTTLQEIYYDLEKSNSIVSEMLPGLDFDVFKGGPSLWWPLMFDAMGNWVLKHALR